MKRFILEFNSDESAWIKLACEICGISYEEELKIIYQFDEFNTDYALEEKIRIAYHALIEDNRSVFEQANAGLINDDDELYYVLWTGEEAGDIKDLFCIEHCKWSSIKNMAMAGVMIGDWQYGFKNEEDAIWFLNQFGDEYFRWIYGLTDV